MKNMTLIFTTFLTLYSGLSHARETTSVNIANLAGCYKTESKLCTSLNNGKSCSGQFYDYLKIQPLGQNYSVELFSTQANQNVCSFSFEMKENNGMLVHETEYGNVSLQRKKNVLMISSKGIDPTAIGLGVCGIHADINGLIFPLKSKLKLMTECSWDEK